MVQTNQKFIQVPKPSPGCLACAGTRKSSLEGNQYKWQVWIYCPVGFCSVLFGKFPTSSVLCPQVILEGMKNSSHNYFQNMKASFLTGISDSLHKKPRWALFWLKLTFPWFQGRQNWLLLYSEKNQPFQGLTHLPMWIVLVLIWNTNIPL